MKDKAEKAIGAPLSNWNNQWSSNTTLTTTPFDYGQATSGTTIYANAPSGAMSYTTGSLGIS
jgi:hypothetical protein